MNIDRFKYKLTTPSVINPFLNTYNYTDFVSYQDVIDKVLIFPDKIKNILKLNISTDYILDIITNRLGIPFYQLIDYSLIECNKSILIEENALYKDKINLKTNKKKREYFNVYLVESQNIDLIITRVFKILLFEIYPDIFNNQIFYKEVPKYNTNVLFNINENISISDLYMLLLINNKTSYTIKEILDVFNGKATYNDTKEESLFHIYYDKYNGVSLYLIIDEDKSISLTIPINALKFKDWDLIENYYVHNIGKTNIKEGIFTGYQKEAWYFNHPLVIELKKYFK